MIGIYLLINIEKKYMRKSYIEIVKKLLKKLKKK